MALADRLTTGPKRPPTKTCAVCWLASWIPDGDREAFAAMLDDVAKYPAFLAARELSDEYDAAVGADAVQRHRRLHMGAE